MAASLDVPRALQPVPAPSPCDLLVGSEPRVFAIKFASVKGLRSVFFGRNYDSINIENPKVYIGGKVGELTLLTSS